MIRDERNGRGTEGMVEGRKGMVGGRKAGGRFRLERGLSGRSDEPSSSCAPP
jgi:hypothetical protein